MPTINPLQIKNQRVACVGDSITEAYSYPQQLQRLLGNNYTVLNFGFSGSTVSLDSETPYMQSPVFWSAKASQPNIVIIMLGTNDAQPSLEQYIGNFADDYIELIRHFQNLPTKPKIWLVKPPPIFGENNGLSKDRFDKQILPCIEAVANKTGLPTIDVHSVFVNRPDCFPYDGVHPNDEAIILITCEISKVFDIK